MPINERYRVQVDLLIRCLPAVAKVRAYRTALLPPLCRHDG